MYSIFKYFNLMQGDLYKPSVFSWGHLVHNNMVTGFVSSVIM